MKPPFKDALKGFTHCPHCGKAVDEEQRVKDMCKLFNSLIEDGRLHIGIVPEWVPEHPEGGKMSKGRMQNETYRCDLKNKIQE